MPGVYGLAGAQHRLPKACAPRGVCAGLALWQGSPCLRFSSAPRWSCRSRSRATKAASRYRTCGAPAGSMDGAAGASKAEEVPVGGWKTCRRCQGKFHEGTRIGGCTFHPESFSGETAQRWLVSLLVGPRDAMECAASLNQPLLSPTQSHASSRPASRREAVMSITFGHAVGTLTRTTQVVARRITLPTTTTMMTDAAGCVCLSHVLPFCVAVPCPASIRLPPPHDQRRPLCFISQSHASYFVALGPEAHPLRLPLY
mmetsp:Transcript_13780/g.40804  ORF Transcript_13780/g.40804 Transcript_13780/m.40804 type:complete len:257 (+) Transcript_13780:8-778(+)